MADIEWTTVKAKRVNVNRAAKHHHDSTTLNKQLLRQLVPAEENDDGTDPEDVTNSCRKILLSLTKSVFMNLLMKEFVVTGFQECSSIISLGIGKFTSSPSALLQLAMVLCMQNEITDASSTVVDNIAYDQDTSIASSTDVSKEITRHHINCKVFDPMFSLKERNICRNLGLDVSDENKRGKHRTENGPTIFFMPHCPHRLYVNLLWENWNNLGDVIIFGNR